MADDVPTTLFGKLKLLATDPERFKQLAKEHHEKTRPAREAARAERAAADKIEADAKAIRVADRKQEIFHGIAQNEGIRRQMTALVEAGKISTATKLANISSDGMGGIRLPGGKLSTDAAYERSSAPPASPAPAPRKELSPEAKKNIHDGVRLGVDVMNPGLRTLESIVAIARPDLAQQMLVKEAVRYGQRLHGTSPVGVGPRSPAEITPGAGKAYLNKGAASKASRSTPAAKPRSSSRAPAAGGRSDGRTEGYSRVGANGLVVQVQGYSTPKR